MPDEGAGAGGRGERTGRERETMRMGCMGRRVMSTGVAAGVQNSNGDNNKMARKTTKEREEGVRLKCALKNRII